MTRRDDLRAAWPVGREDARAWPPTNDAGAAGMLMQQPMPPGSSHEPAPIIGRRVRMSATPVGGGAQFAVQETQLISARLPSPRQWVVTVSPVLTGDGATPWTMRDGDGAAPNPIQGAPYIAPATTGQLQLKLRWGAGGASQLAVFDYPMQGASFGVTADALDLNAFIAGNSALNPYASENAIPVLGAFMVEGRPVDSTPLRWLQNSQTVPAGGIAWFAIKPYAKTVTLRVQAGFPAVTDLVFEDNAGAVVWSVRLTAGQTEATVQVPHEATILSVQMVAGTSFQLLWNIGLQ